MSLKNIVNHIFGNHTQDREKILKESSSSGNVENPYSYVSKDSRFIETAQDTDFIKNTEINSSKINSAESPTKNTLKKEHTKPKESFEASLSKEHDYFQELAKSFQGKNDFNEMDHSKKKTSSRSKKSSGLKKEEKRQYRQKSFETSKRSSRTNSSKKKENVEVADPTKIIRKTQFLTFKDFQKLEIGNLVTVDRGMVKKPSVNINNKYVRRYKDSKGVYACVNYEYAHASKRVGTPQYTLSDWDKKLQRSIEIDGRKYWMREHTHLVPFRYCRLEDDRVLINGTTHLNMGSRPDKKFIIQKEDRRKNKKKFEDLIKKFDGNFISGKYLSRSNSPEGTHYSLEDFEEFSTDYMKKEKDKKFIYYGIALYKDTNNKKPPVSVEIGFYDLSDKKYIFRALLDNVE